jgi:hypothetical protein
MATLYHSNRVNHKVSKSGHQLLSFLKESPTCVTFKAFVNDLVRFKKKKKEKKKGKLFSSISGQPKLEVSFELFLCLVELGEYRRLLAA